MCDKCSLGELGRIPLHVLDLLLKTLYQILQAGCVLLLLFFVTEN